MDLGRYRISQNPRDSFRFQIPSLRNLSYTYPYMHDGRFEYLKEVIGHYTDGIATIPNLGKELTSGVSLSPSEQKDLTAFLFTLNDSSFCFDPRFGFLDRTKPQSDLRVKSQKPNLKYQDHLL